MILSWLDASKAVETGISLADQLVPRTKPALLKSGTLKPQTPVEALQEILAQTDHGLRAENLNFYKRAKLANSFKWRLIESGVERATADEVTQELVLSLSQYLDKHAVDDHPDGEQKVRPAKTNNAKQLLAQGNKCMAQGAYLQAADIFNDLLELDPHHAVALNNLGSALSRLSRLREAEEYFRSAVKIRPDFVEAHTNLGLMLRLRGHFIESEKVLRQAVKINPRYVEARVALGMTLALLHRFREATGHFKKALKTTPRDPEALLGMGQIAGMEGRFDESEKILKRALESNPKMPAVLADLARLRKMTPADDAWRRTVEELAGSGIAPMESASLHFALGKYHDDIGQFECAFKEYRTANELMKPFADGYNREKRKDFVDRLIGLQPTKPTAAAPDGASASTKPVFVVGMPRSGTSLTEQIIASHPMAKGAGELDYWNTVVLEHGAEVLQGQNAIDERAKQQLAEGYLRTLENVSATALRVVDKAPLNSDHLGVIHSIFPNARIVYMRRDPIDICLSCYFQNFSLAHSFTLDLSDLAHYYQEHHRLMNHWRTVLPRGSILEVPYEELVADQEGWTRKILDFIELDWDARCLEFQATERPVVTASFWQARQKIFKTSVQRWRNYEKFVDQIPALRKLHS
jgi:tetratricopeptide (TPR) repeat protein